MKPEDKQTIFQNIRKDILRYSNIDVQQTSRRDEIVEARMVFTQIIHEGFDLHAQRLKKVISLQEVAKFLNLNQHGSILNYLENFSIYVLTSKYDTKDLYDTLHTKYIKYKCINKVSTIEELENKRNKLINELSKINTEINKYKELTYGIKEEEDEHDS